jgi:FKBP-type peptidyl-prolyl cis-trans isomerase SlyD
VQVTKNTVVAIDYTLKDNEGQVIDSSAGREPLSYLHGNGAIIPGLERELEGKQVGDSLRVTVAPEDAYGERNETLRQEMPHDRFGDVENLSVGMQFKVDSNAGPLVITVVDINDEAVTVDGNHPLAGLPLNFDVTVRDVRPATPEELAHGHVH